MKNRLRLVSLLAAVGLTVLPLGEVAVAQTATSQVNDETIVTAVKAALAAKPELKAADLKITSKNAEVTLAGPVEDGHQLYQIGLVVQAVQGVKYVISEMVPKH